MPMCVCHKIACQCDRTAAETHAITWQMKVTLALQGSSRCLQEGDETISQSSGDRCEVDMGVLCLFVFSITCSFML